MPLTSGFRICETHPLSGRPSQLGLSVTCHCPGASPSRFTRVVSAFCLHVGAGLLVSKSSRPQGRSRHGLKVATTHHGFDAQGLSRLPTVAQRKDSIAMPQLPLAQNAYLLRTQRPEGKDQAHTQWVNTLLVPRPLHSLPSPAAATRHHCSVPPGPLL